jgi:hypothetical protein
MLSLKLRKQINSKDLKHSEIKELQNFEITDESDGTTMAESGVWADHVSRI